MAQPVSPPALEIPRSRALAGERARSVLVAGAAFGLLVGAGAANGGYFPGAWGWLTLAGAWIAALALVLDVDVALSRAGVATLALLTAFAGWTLLSSVWSVDVTQTALEAQRTLVYVAGFGAALLLARRSERALLGGAWAAVLVLSSYALATRLVPDRFGIADAIAGSRLSEPIGYWNSLGLYAAMGTLLAVGFAARGRAVSTRLAGAASLPLLVTTLYFTFSRGAWVSLLVGVAALLLLDPRRLQTLAALAVTGPWAAIAVALAAHSHGLTTNGVSVPLQAHDGHRLVLLLVPLVAGAAASSGGLALLERRIDVDEPAQRRLTQGLAATVALAVIGLFAALGAPWTLARRSWNAFAGSSPATGGDLNARLFHLSGTGRLTQWQVAWHHEVAAHPLLGSGAATYQRYWERYRPTGGHIVNVHNLYLEVLATLGPVGLALLLGVFAVPLVVAVRRRRNPLVPMAFGAWCAYLVHAIVDWDWQITSVTLVAFACAAALVSTRREAELAPRLRRAGIAAAVLAGALAIWGIAMQVELTRIGSASGVAAATRAAQTASDIQPWSTEPWQLLAGVQIAAHEFADARVSLRRALAADPRDWSLWFDLAQASAGKAQTRALDRALRLDPLEPEVLAARQSSGAGT